MNVSNVFFFFFCLHFFLSLSWNFFLASTIFSIAILLFASLRKSLPSCVQRALKVDGEKFWILSNSIPPLLFPSLSLSLCFSKDGEDYLNNFTCDSYSRRLWKRMNFSIFKGESDARTSFVSIFEASLYMFEKKSASWDTHTRTHTYTRTHTQGEEKKKFNPMWTQ